MPYVRFFVFFLIGIIIGLVFKSISYSLIISVMAALLVACEIYGHYGYGRRWREYRLVSLIFYFVPIVCCSLGIVLGQGDIGRALISIGKLIS
jgi:hypothetical protein